MQILSSHMKAKAEFIKGASWTGVSGVPRQTHYDTSCPRRTFEISVVVM